MAPFVWYPFLSSPTAIAYKNPCIYRRESRERVQNPALDQEILRFFAIFFYEIASMGVCGSKPKGCVGMKDKLKLQKRRRKPRKGRGKGAHSSNRVEPSNQRDLSFNNPAFQGSIFYSNFCFVFVLFNVYLGFFVRILVRLFSKVVKRSWCSVECSVVVCWWMGSLRPYTPGEIHSHSFDMQAITHKYIWVCVIYPKLCESVRF